MSTPELRSSYRTSIHGGNSRNCAKSMHIRCSAKAPTYGDVQPQPARPSGGGEQGLRTGRQVLGAPRPAPRAPLCALTQGPGAALFDGFVLAPGRFLLQLPQDLFHLDLRRSRDADSQRSARGRAGDAAAAATWPCAPRRPLRPPASGPRAAAMNHARCEPRATSAPSPRPARRGQVRSERGGGDRGLGPEVP